MFSKNKGRITDLDSLSPTALLNFLLG